MTEANHWFSPPSLTALCIDHLKRKLVLGDDAVVSILPDIYELPSHLIEDLISSLPPIGLYNFQLHLPFQDLTKEDFLHDDSTNKKRKRSRDWNLNTAWQKKFELRWPNLINQIQPTDWQKVYWETHLQKCLDDATEKAILSSFIGRIGDIQVLDSSLNDIGLVGLTIQSYRKYSKLSYHCLQFGSHVSCLILQNVMCNTETTRLLRECKLESLVLRCIRSKEQVVGLCKLISQNSRTLTSLEFIHCTVYIDFINAILDSVVSKGVEKHGIKHLSIVSSSFGQGTFSLPSGLESFVSSARSLCSLKLFDSHLGRNFAKALFMTLLNVSSSISVLDLSENDIAGCFSYLNRRLSIGSHLAVGIGKSLQLLRVLNLRGNNLRKEDAESLRYALAYMSNLEDLDISDNPIEDEGIRHLIPYFAGTCCRVTSLKLEACDLSHDGVNRFLDSFSPLNSPLKSLCIAENYLGSKVAGALGRFFSTSIEVLDAAGIDLHPTGFQELQSTLITTEKLKLVKINISKNRGGIETAHFLSKLLLQTPELVDVNASNNSMPIESLPIISSALKLAKGKVQHLDLTGHRWDYKPEHASLLAEFVYNGKSILILPLLLATAAPYDHDP
ncbi:uncharacterized protein LOC131610054 [Vicia villosa]|uniref:uncharacterized protein LOC131610054 n=1 Tax=Vicia villosa TaxID=3911 RepID=UPI00273AFCA5|nr:uncharacterized protein LOC131610054 [Vicia villosa]